MLIQLQVTKDLLDRPILDVYKTHWESLESLQVYSREWSIKIYQNSSKSLVLCGLSTLYILQSGYNPLDSRFAIKSERNLNSLWITKENVQISNLYVNLYMKIVYEFCI